MNPEPYPPQVLTEDVRTPLPAVSKFPKLRLLELILILMIAFGGSMFGSLYAFFGNGAVGSGGMSSSAQAVYMMISELTAIGALAYVLFRQGRTFSGIGLSFQWRDLVSGLGVAFLAYIAYSVAFVFLSSFGNSVGVREAAEAKQQEVAHALGLSVPAFLLMLINPFFEEIIVRAYAMTELKAIVGNTFLTVLISVVFQGLYHLYQGGILAISYSILFLVFSIFYVRTKRIWPVIIAHAIFDVGSLAAYALR